MSADFDPCGDVRSEACTEKLKSHRLQCFIFAHVVTGWSSVEVSEKFTPQWLWNNDEGYLLGMIKNRFEENQFSLDDLYYVLLKDCYVSSMNCGKVIYVYLF